MKFDKNRVFTALNADELKVGSKVYVADDMARLYYQVDKEKEDDIETIAKILDYHNANRFAESKYGNVYSLAYLIEEPKEDKYRPYKDGDEAFMYLHNKWLINKGGGAKRIITDFFIDSVYFCDDKISFTTLFNNFEIYSLTGKNEPCGVKVNKDENETN